MGPEFTDWNGVAVMSNHAFVRRLAYVSIFLFALTPGCVPPGPPPGPGDPDEIPARYGKGGGPRGVLDGKRVMLSPGHGFYHHPTYGWTTQRGLTFGLIEDHHNNEMAIDWLAPMLEGAGAMVITTRERDRNVHEVVLDQDDGGPGYVESGAWQPGANPGDGRGGRTYRQAVASRTPGAVASWLPAIPESGRFAVYEWHPAGPDRVADARFAIRHSGGESIVRVDQRIDGSRWLYLGTFHFEKGVAGQGVHLSNESAGSGLVVADSVRFGGGMGSIARGGKTSGKPRWLEASRYWAEYSGAPASVYDGSTDDRYDDIYTRARLSKWWNADAHVMMHTNAAGGTGTSTFVHRDASAASRALRDAIHDRIVRAVRARWSPTWKDRGKLEAGYGELREVQPVPAMLYELAFHDQPDPDVPFLKNDAFRRDATRAVLAGVIESFAPGGPIPPLPPTSVRARGAGRGVLEVSWRNAVDPLEPTAVATGALVHLSTNGFGFDEGTWVENAESFTFTDLPPGRTYYVRVASTNQGGRGLPSPVVACRLSADGAPAGVLVVDGFDRLDRTVTRRVAAQPADVVTGRQTFDHVVEIARALAPAFDGAANEAVRDGDLALGPYRAVVWTLGEESTADETFDAAEQAVVAAYLRSGGALLVTGNEVAWDLGAKGTAADRAFLRDVLGVEFARDAASGDAVQAGGPVFAGLSTRLGTASGSRFPCAFPDVVTPAGAARAELVYGASTDVAAASRSGPDGKVVFFGFALEAVGSDADRAALVARALGFLLD